MEDVVDTPHFSIDCAKTECVPNACKPGPRLKGEGEERRGGGGGGGGGRGGGEGREGRGRGVE